MNWVRRGCWRQFWMRGHGESWVGVGVGVGVRVGVVVGMSAASVGMEFG